MTCVTFVSTYLNQKVLNIISNKYKSSLKDTRSGLYLFHHRNYYKFLLQKVHSTSTHNLDHLYLSNCESSNAELINALFTKNTDIEFTNKTEYNKLKQFSNYANTNTSNAFNQY